MRLAATQRVVRAQHFDATGMLAHFQLFAMVSAGRDTGNRAFEHHHLTEHLQFAARALSRVGTEHAEIRLTCLDEASIRVLERTCAALAATPGIDVLDDPDRATPRTTQPRFTSNLLRTEAGRDPYNPNVAAASEQAPYVEATDLFNTTKP